MTALAPNPCSSIVQKAKSQVQHQVHMLSICFTKIKVAVYPHTSSGGDLDCSLDEEPDQTGLIS